MPETPEQKRARVSANVAKMLAQGAPEPDVEYYITAVEGLAPSGAAPDGAEKLHAEYKAGTLAPRIASENAQERGLAEADEGFTRQAAGGIASLIKDVPGGEAAQAGVRALVRRQPYREALSDIQGAEEAAPSAVRNLNRLAGGTLAYAANPLAKGAPAGWRGAQFGALSALGSSDPDKTATDRIDEAPIAAGLGAVADRVGLRVARKIGIASPPARGGTGNRGTPLSLVERPVSLGKVPPPTPKLPTLTLADPPIEPLAPVAQPTPRTSAPKPSLDDQMRDLIRRVGGNPDAPPEWTDAEIAMGHDQYKPDLEELLRQSIQLKGGKPVVPRTSNLRPSP